MPMTRSRSNKSANRPANGNDIAEPGTATASGSAEPEPRDTVAVIEGHLSGLVKNMKSLKREVGDLRKRNEELEAQLADAREELENAAQPKRGAKARVGAKELQKKVSELKGQMRELEKAHEKDKRKIKQMKANEIKRDAQDLQDETEFEVGDTAQKMRKLLRRFHDIILANALDTDEECAICMCPMEVRKARSFPCEHTFCDECTRQLDGDHEMVRCPTCRTEAARDDLEVVEYTATAQWDALLSVATSWAKIDRRGSQDTSDEEAEEESIDDGTTETKSASEGPPVNPLESSPEPDTNGLETEENGTQRASASQTSRIKRRMASPPAEGCAASGSGAHDEQEDEEGEDSSALEPPATGSQPGYSQYTPAEKRKRMEELAEARSQKRRRS